jgi:hypothetical protein
MAMKRREKNLDIKIDNLRRIKLNKILLSQDEPKPRKMAERKT